MTTPALYNFMLQYLFSRFPPLDNRWSEYECRSWWSEYERLMELYNKFNVHVVVAKVFGDNHVD